MGTTSSGRHFGGIRIAPTIDMCTGEKLGKVPAGASKAAANVQDGGRVNRPRKSEHVVTEVIFCPLEVLLEGPPLALFVGIGA